MFQTGDVVYGEGKLRDLGIVFKPSFKCLKNQLTSSDSETRNFTLSEYINILSSYILFAERFWFKKKKESGLRE